LGIENREVHRSIDLFRQASKWERKRKKNK
jgi:hypothetical protein